MVFPGRTVGLCLQPDAEQDREGAQCMFVLFVYQCNVCDVLCRVVWVLFPSLGSASLPYSRRSAQ